MAEVIPFRIDVPEAELADLRRRLRQTRWPEREPVEDWSQGVPLAYLRELCGYWADGYDWRATEARLNALPQFQTVIDRLPVHFIHLRSPHPEALPLIITHGWPGSVVEFLKVFAGARDPAADDRLRAGRLPRRARRLDRGEVLVVDRSFWCPGYRADPG